MAWLIAAVMAGAASLPFFVATAICAVSGQPPLSVPTTLKSCGEIAAWYASDALGPTYVSMRPDWSASRTSENCS